MRFPRNAKIFRGQLDFAPLAGVLFLLLIFLLLGSLISPPGIRLQLASQAELNKSPEKKFIIVTRHGDIVYQGQTNNIDSLDRVRAEFKNLSPNETVLMHVESGAPKEVVARVRQTLEPSIQLPTGDSLVGTENQTLTVAISLSGQCFFENELVPIEQLRARLEKAKGNSKDAFTLVVFADKTTTDETIFRLGQIANRAGIQEMLLAGRPRRVPTAPPVKP